VLPILWILGASGVGKSTVGFRLVHELGGVGILAALVDADQLRLARGLDLTETELIASGLPPLEREFRARGAQVLIVSGIADDADHLAALLSGLRDHPRLTVHLDVDADALRERIRHRGSLIGEMEENVEYAARLDPHLADLRLDTTGRSPSELATRITADTFAFLEHHQLQHQDTVPGDPDLDTPPRQVVLISGPGGVGLSTVGYSAYSRIAGPAAYLDAHQLGLLGTGSRAEELAPMRAVNTRAVAGNLTRAGADFVVVTGDPRTIRLLNDAWDPATVTTVWLHASRDALADRIALRAKGRGPGIPGDHRVGLTGPALADAVTTAVRERAGERLMPPGTSIIDTSMMTVAEVAEAIVISR
jgi:predicted ABC-type ATPase